MAWFIKKNDYYFRMITKLQLKVTSYKQKLQENYKSYRYLQMLDIISFAKSYNKSYKVTAKSYRRGYIIIPPVTFV